MEQVKSTAKYKIFKKRSGRYGVKSADGKWINGIEKVKILNKEGLITAVAPKVEAPVVTAPSEAENKKEEAKEEKESKGA